MGITRLPYPPWTTPLKDILSLDLDLLGLDLIVLLGAARDIGIQDPMFL